MDGLGFQALGLIAGTLAASWVAGWALQFLRRGEDIRRQQEAEKVLMANGMEAHTYLPSFAAEPGPLRDALATFDHTNKLVLDRDGRLVGRVLPKVQSNGPELRLVVDNTRQRKPAP